MNPAEIRIEAATTQEELEGLRTEWHDLWARCQNVTPFQSPEWLIPWWQHLGKGTLWVLSLWVDDQLRGLAPFLIQDSTSSSEREVLLLGTGPTDYLDILLEPGFETFGAGEFLNYIETHAGVWDVIDFQQLRPGSLLLEWEIQPDWRSEVMVQEVCPVLSLPQSTGSLRFSVCGRMAEKLAYHRRSAAQRGSLRAELANEETYDELFEAWLQLDQGRWQARGFPDVLPRSAVQSFHRDATRQLFNAGLLRLYGMRLGSRIIAALYALSSCGRTFHYLAGFDPAYSELSPGTLVIGYAIEEAIRQGDREFDFLRGRETYKYHVGRQGAA